MKTIRFNCPKCSQTFEVPQEMAGKQIACSNCGNLVGIPDAYKVQLVGTVLIMAALGVIVLISVLTSMKKDITNAPLANHTTNTAPVTGAAGFLLGGKLEADYSPRADEDGGFHFDANYTNLPPFDRISVNANRERVIYDIALDGSEREQFQVTLGALSNALSEKYGLRYFSDAKEIFISFGGAEQTLSLMGLPTTGSFWLTYSDVKLSEAFRKQKEDEAVNKAKRVSSGL